MNRKHTISVKIGTRVTLRNVETEEILTYTLATPEKADPSVDLISTASPLASGILGHKAGETVSFPLRDDYIVLEILKIEHAGAK